MLAVMANFAQLWVVYEYTKDTMRGGSELAVAGIDNGKNKKGLDKDYAFQWSYGKMESFTFLIPNAFGGSSSADFNEESKIYEFLSDKNIPAEASEQISRQLGGYWGPKPFTSGPVYLGVLVCFLFVLGIVVLKDAWRWLHALHTSLHGRSFSWTQLDEVTAACADAYPALIKMIEAAPLASFRMLSGKIARQSHF